MVRPLVSIVVPFFISTSEQAVLLDETLGTIDGQTCTDYEVIAVDDGSPRDVTRTVAAHRHVRLCRQANAGPAVARNAGIAEASGRYLVFLDADDHLLPGALETFVAELVGHPHAGFAVGPREEMTFEGEPVSWPVPSPPPQQDLYAALLAFDWYIIPPSSVIFRREVVDAVGGFRDPWGADDLDFYLRAARLAKARCFQSPAVTRYRRYSTSSSRDGARMLNSVRAVYDRQRAVVDGDRVAVEAFHRGLHRLTEIFRDCLVENVRDRLRAGQVQEARRTARLLAAESPERWESLLMDGTTDRERLSIASDAIS